MLGRACRRRDYTPIIEAMKRGDYFDLRRVIGLVRIRSGSGARGDHHGPTSSGPSPLEFVEGRCMGDRV